MQQSGVIDEETIAELGDLVGANIFIKGVLTEFKDYVDVEISIIDIAKGTIIGGDNYQIEKTQEVSELIGTIVKSEEQIQKELEIYKKSIMEDIEGERTRRLGVLKDEEKKLKTEIDNLEADLRSKSIIIAEYEEKKQEIQKIDAYILKLKNEIDQLNVDIIEKLKIGMTLNQVKQILGSSNLYKSSSSSYISGKHILLFEGNVLTKGVIIGSKSRNDEFKIIDDAIDASVYGVNIISY